MKTTVRVALGLAVIAAAVMSVIVLQQMASTDPRTQPDVGGVLGASVAASTDAAIASSGTTPLDPPVAPEELPGECSAHSTIVERIPTSIEINADMSSAVIRATVDAIGRAQWNTPDGRAPDLDGLSAFQVMRLVRVVPVATLSGQATTSTFWIPGGTIGCQQFSATGFELERGAEYLFFLAANDPKSGLTGTLQVREAWPVVEGSVRSPSEGELSVDDVADRLANSS
jgi:hypothetical protein